MTDIRRRIPKMKLKRFLRRVGLALKAFAKIVIFASVVGYIFFSTAVFYVMWKKGSCLVAEPNLTILTAETVCIGLAWIGVLLLAKYILWSEQ